MQLPNEYYSRYLRGIFSGFLLSLALSTPSSAHLMVAQHGTINIVGNGAFLVLSVPISAFNKVDDDGDKKLSRAEFTQHRKTLIATINEKVRLLEQGKSRPLQGMMLSPVAAHDSPMAPTDQLVVMGKYVLDDINNRLQFHLELFGKKPKAQKQTLSFSNREKSLKNKVVLTPKQTSAELFPVTATVKQ